MTKPKEPIILSSDQIAAANRFEERRARQEADRHSMRGDPVMRARVTALYAGLGASLAPPRSKRRPDYQSVESLAEYGRQLLAVSDAFKATLRRPEAAE